MVANDYNTARIPPALSNEAGASLGVAFVAAALALGMCTGLDFSTICEGPDLLKIVRSLNPSSLPEDTRAECLESIDEAQRMRKGDWLAIWGASSTSAYITFQLARLAGVRTIGVLDYKKHGFAQHSDSSYPRADAIVDSHDPERATEIIRHVSGTKLRFGIDTSGRQTAHRLMQCLGSRIPGDSVSQTPPPTPPHSRSPRVADDAHLIGLTGLPKVAAPPGVVYHSVPIKLFHEVPEVGEALMVWLEKLLAEGLLQPPTILSIEQGFESVNPALDRMRKGEINGGRVVVRLT